VKTRKKEQLFARRLTALSLDAGGLVDAARARAVLAAAAKMFPPAALRPLLARYLGLMRAEIAASEVRVAAAGPLESAAVARLVARFERERGRKFRAVVSEEPALLAGVKARVGDDVFDASAAGALARLVSPSR